VEGDHDAGEGERRGAGEETRAGSVRPERHGLEREEGGLMKDPLIAWLEEDPMNVRIFLEYDRLIPWWSKIVFRVKLFLGM